jgi:hypothetical protein
MSRRFSTRVTMAALGAASMFAAEARAADWLSMPVAGGGGAAAASPTVAAQGNSGDATNAKVRVLDKNTNRTTVVDVAAGKTAVAPGVSISMRRCVKDVQGVPGQDVAWLDVIETNGNAPVYSGWMFNFYPDVAALENPRYEVRLVSCARSGPPAQAPIRKAPKDDASSMGNDDEEAPSGNSGGNDPNFVPGVKDDDGAAQPEGTRIGPPAAAPSGGGDDQDELHNMMDNGGMPQRPVGE